MSDENSPVKSLDERLRSQGWILRSRLSDHRDFDVLASELRRGFYSEHKVLPVDMALEGGSLVPAKNGDHLLYIKAGSNYRANGPNDYVQVLCMFGKVERFFRIS